jgi:uncharacterized protein (DUF2147 family)
MRAQATATTGCSPRRAVIRIKSIVAVCSRLMAAASLGAFCVAGAAIADPAKISATDVEGRWVFKKYKLTVDVSRCGAGWCGVEVTDRASGAECGRTALRFDAGEEAGQYVSFRGRLERAANSQSYAILANLQRRDGALTLSMHGHTGDDLNPFRRTFDFNDVVARAGGGVCRPDPKLS